MEPYEMEPVSDITSVPVSVMPPASVGTKTGCLLVWQITTCNVEQFYDPSKATSVFDWARWLLHVLEIMWCFYETRSNPFQNKVSILGIDARTIESYSIQSSFEVRAGCIRKGDSQCDLYNVVEVTSQTF